MKKKEHLKIQKIKMVSQNNLQDLPNIWFMKDKGKHVEGNIEGLKKGQ